MITSWPREIRSVPRVSGESIAWPPGLSVIESTSIRGSAASSRATSRTRWLLSAVISPRLVTSSAATTNAPGRANCSRRAGISSLSLPDLSSPHGRPARARRRDGSVGGAGLRLDRSRLGSRAPGRLHRRIAGSHGRRPRGCTLGAFASVADGEIEEHLGTPEFLLVRALAIEAFYSDFVAPGVDATGAWAEIDFNTPLATRLAKDWSYLGIS